MPWGFFVETATCSAIVGIFFNVVFQVIARDLPGACLLLTGDFKIPNGVGLHI
jgi:hypothetical protein